MLGHVYLLIHMDARLYIMSGGEALHCSYLQVSEAMYRVEHNMSPCSEPVEG